MSVAINAWQKILYLGIRVIMQWIINRHECYMAENINKKAKSIQKDNEFCITSGKFNIFSIQWMWALDTQITVEFVYIL